MGSIHFFSEDTEFELSNAQGITNWVKNIIQHEGFELLELNYVFCSDTYLNNINVQYLDHDTYTDIITFDNSESPDQIEGDIFISIERVRDNATALMIDFENELHRVIIHGVLHLMGHRDKTEEEKQDMRKREEACLSLWPEK